MVELELLRRASEVAVACLLDVKNEHWREDDEDELSEDEFVARLGFVSSEESEEGISVVLSDGELFWGHAIVVFLPRDPLTPATAQLQG